MGASAHSVDDLGGIPSGGNMELPELREPEKVPASLPAMEVLDLGKIGSGDEAEELEREGTSGAGADAPLPLSPPSPAPDFGLPGTWVVVLFLPGSGEGVVDDSCALHLRTATPGLHPGWGRDADLKAEHDACVAHVQQQLQMQMHMT